MFGFLKRSSSGDPDNTVAPFTTFDGWLKSHRPVDFDELQKIAMKASFARFYNEAEVSPLIQESWAYAFNDDSPSRGREAPYRYRRFSGGQDLPSGRYYSVCMNELGHDGGTL